MVRGLAGLRGSGGHGVARYGDAEPAAVGLAARRRAAQGKAALVELPLGRGKVVLFGFRPQYRAQSWATYVALLNALYLSAARP